MKLKDIQGEYDFVVSLGASCQTAHQLQVNNLRSFSGPLDWFVCNSLHRINVALLDKLTNIMQKDLLVNEGYHDDISLFGTNLMISYQSMISQLTVALTLPIKHLEKLLIEE